jgi:hypothetical protein
VAQHTWPGQSEGLRQNRLVDWTVLPDVVVVAGTVDVPEVEAF